MKFYMQQEQNNTNEYKISHKTVTPALCALITICHSIFLARSYGIGVRLIEKVNGLWNDGNLGGKGLDVVVCVTGVVVILCLVKMSLDWRHDTYYQEACEKLLYHYHKTQEQRPLQKRRQKKYHQRSYHKYPQRRRRQPGLRRSISNDFGIEHKTLRKSSFSPIHGDSKRQHTAKKYHSTNNCQTDHDCLLNQKAIKNVISWTPGLSSVSPLEQTLSQTVSPTTSTNHEVLTNITTTSNNNKPYSRHSWQLSSTFPEMEKNAISDADNTATTTTATLDEDTEEDDDVHRHHWRKSIIQLQSPYYSSDGLYESDYLIRSSEVSMGTSSLAANEKEALLAMKWDYYKAENEQPGCIPPLFGSMNDQFSYHTNNEVNDNRLDDGSPRCKAYSDAADRMVKTTWTLLLALYPSLVWLIWRLLSEELRSIGRSMILAGSIILGVRNLLKLWEFSIRRMMTSYDQIVASDTASQTINSCHAALTPPQKATTSPPFCALFLLPSAAVYLLLISCNGKALFGRLILHSRADITPVDTEPVWSSYLQAYTADACLFGPIMVLITTYTVTLGVCMLRPDLTRFRATSKSHLK